jgi:hypothetical protein
VPRRTREDQYNPLPKLSKHPKSKYWHYTFVDAKGDRQRGSTGTADEKAARKFAMDVTAKSVERDVITMLFTRLTPTPNSVEQVRLRREAEMERGFYDVLKRKIEWAYLGPPGLVTTSEKRKARKAAPEATATGNDKELYIWPFDEKLTQMLFDANVMESLESIAKWMKERVGHLQICDVTPSLLISLADARGAETKNPDMARQYLAAMHDFVRSSGGDTWRPLTQVFIDTKGAADGDQG